MLRPLSVMLALLPVTTPLAAAPHTISAPSEVHGYDPDWPDVYLIVMSKCAGCHRPATKNCDLTSYEAIREAQRQSGGPIVVPGNPERSPLYTQVKWNAAGRADSPLPKMPEMPYDAHEWLTAGQQETIRRWIERGARQYCREPCTDRPLMEIDYPSARVCKACHPRQYEQWSRSMHHYGQLSPIFEAFNQTLLERTSGTIGTFCTRCHTPLGTALGENGLRRNVHRSRLSMEGVTCVVCHRQARPYYKSNARTAIEPGGLLTTCMYGPFDDALSSQTKTHPSVRAPHIKSAAFCGACHDVTNPQGVRLEEAFSEWQNSPAAKQGFTCQHCHMGPVQGVPIPDKDRPWGRVAQVPGIDPERIPLRPLTDHTFAGPDYALVPDTEFPYKLDWMYEIDYRRWQSLTPHQKKTLAELRRRNRRQRQIADQKRYELLRNAARITVAAPQEAPCGGPINVRVDVTSTTAGHNFPTGFTAERQAWVSVTLRDPTGRVVFASGDLGPNGDLRDGHSYAVELGKVPRDRHLLNFQNKFTAVTARGTERTVVLSVNRHLQPLNIVRPAIGISASFGRPFSFRVAKGSLPPLKTVGHTYPIVLPACAGDYLLEARLNFRHLPPALLDQIGTPHLKHLLEIVVIDEYRSVIRVR